MKDVDEFMSNLMSQMSDQELDILFTILKETEEEDERKDTHE